jgi:SAM-dependent methyltransferase
MPLGGDDEVLWDLQTLAEAERLCDWMFAQVHLDDARHVAEIGAGIGTFSHRLLAAGVENLLLVEPDATCAVELERRFVGDPRVNVAREQLPESESLAERPGAFDLVVCQNVLEHIEDDGAAVRAMAAAIRPGGRLYVLVPAHQRCFGSLDRAYGHYRRYGRDRLRALAREANLRIDRLYAFNLLGVLGWWLSNKRGAREIGALPLSAYDKALVLWRPLEQRLRPRVGLSLILEARRPT